MLFTSLLITIILLGIMASICVFQLKKARNQLMSKNSALASAEQHEQQLQQAIAQVKNELHYAKRDPITHLPTSLIFEDRLQQQIKESNRNQITLGMLMIAIDDFAIIANSLGVEVGNELLSQVAKRLETCIRQVDTVSRYHENIFVVLLTQLAKADTAALVAQRILQVLIEPFSVKQHELYITAGIGIAIYPSDGQDPLTLMHNAEHALSLAKSKGTNIYQFYQEKVHINSKRELALSTYLKRDSLYNELIIFYQPILNVQTETVFCMDATVCWQHPELGLISYDELSQYTARQHKLNQITIWLLQAAGKQFLHWHSLGFQPEYLGLQVSLNQLEDSHFIYRISQILQELKFKPEWLILEIKESSNQLSFEIIEKAVNMLQYIGVKLAIDNFGSNSFAFSYLKNIKINFLKLDHSFVDDIEYNSQSIIIIKSLISMTNDMAIQVIAQDVDTDQQAYALQNLGCFLLQGRLFSPPIRENEVASKMLASISDI